MGIVASDSDQSAKVAAVVRPISDEETPGSSLLFGINCLIGRCTDRFLLVYVLICCLEIGSDAVGMISVCVKTQNGSE